MPTPNMGMTLPTDHGSSGTWGSLLNNALTNQIDSHDHTTGKGVAIPSAALNINADVGLNTHALTNALAYDLIPTTAASVATYTNALFSNSALNSGDLCWRNNAGTVIQITSGNSLNFSVTGGFGGDYSSVGALASFTDSTDTYTFQQQIGNAVRQYGKVACGDIALFEYKANPTAGVPTNAVTMKSPASLAAAYSLTWLTGLPAATGVIQVSSAGQLTALSANLFPSNQDIQLQGTGKYKHAQKSIFWWALQPLASVAAGTVSQTGGQNGATLAVSTNCYFPVMACMQDITLQVVKVNFTAAPANSVTVEAFTGSTNGTSFVTTGFSTSGTTATLTLTLTGGFPMNGSGPLWIRVQTGAVTGCTVAGFEVDYTV